MKCPNCGKEECRYIEPRKDEVRGLKKYPVPRTNFKVKCKKCGWEGEI